MTFNKVQIDDSNGDDDENVDKTARKRNLGRSLNLVANDDVRKD